MKYGNGISENKPNDFIIPILTFALEVLFRLISVAIRCFFFQVVAGQIIIIIIILVRARKKRLEFLLNHIGILD